MTHDNSENARRIRSLVRVVMSPGVWLVIVVQSFMFFALFGMSESEEAIKVSGYSWLASAVSIVLMMAFAYLTSGMFQAFAQNRGAVPISAVLSAAHKVFHQFLWLIVKAILLAIILMQVLLTFTMITTGMELKEVITNSSGLFGWAAAFSGFILVYWMPTVFLNQDFKLITTLRTALITAWRRISRAGYLAILTLTPATILMVLNEPAIEIVWALNVLAGLMDWIAYTYCLESLQPVTADGDR